MGKLHKLFAYTLIGFLIWQPPCAATETVAGVCDFQPLAPKKALSYSEQTTSARNALTAAGYEATDLGSGAFGAVFRVKPRLNWLLRRLPVAIQKRIPAPVKTVKVFFNPDDERRDKNRNYEVQVMQHLSQRIPTYKMTDGVEIGIKGQTLKMIEMAFIPEAPGSQKGAPKLSSVLANQTDWLSPERKASIITQLREKLRTAHELGVLHLDLSPSNILVSKDANGEPVVHLIDWGLSVARDLGPNPIQKEGFTNGTPGYIDEQRLRAKPPQPTNDLFSLRMIEWEIGAAGKKVDHALATRFQSGKPVRGHARNAFTQPAIALDEEGSLRERMLAYSVWSSFPTDFPTRDAFLERTKTLPAEVVLKEWGEKLTAASSHAGAIELLSSSLLIDQMGTGLQLSPETLNGFGITVALIYLRNKNIREGIEHPGWLDPARELYYERFIKVWKTLPTDSGHPAWEQLLDRAQKIIDEDEF